MIDFFQSYSNLFFSMGIHILLALSVYITLKAGLLTMGHAGFMAIGAYTSSLLTLHGMFPFAVNVIIGMLASMLVGIAIGVPVLRLHGVYLAIATVAFSELVKFMIMNMEITGGAMGLTGIPKETKIWYLLIVIGLLVYFFRVYEKSQYGRTLLAIGEDEIAVNALGIPTTFHKVFAFAIGAAIAGLAGGLAAHHSFIISPKEYDFNMAVTVILFTLFGGVKNIGGPILGAVVLTALPELFRSLADWRMLIYGVALLLVILFLPKGIIELFYIKGFGSRNKRKKSQKHLEEENYVRS